MGRITKLPVTNGVYWIEVPEADLRVLCGCPGDSVKHLIKNGLIRPRAKDGIVFESGPNAILLSDLILQNGEFCNLSEFPVLQMLYRQGMILPNHPNNNGEKPLLVGSSEQVEAQKQYIYRGNYGLISKEEIVQAGIDKQTAADMMRLKLRFAFGRIKPSSELLDTRVISNEQLEMKNRVFVCRKSENVFEFQYEGEAEEVDLNLKPGEKYGSAYHLSFQKVKREFFGVIHSGEGDGWDISRPSMSSILMFQGNIYLIDAGPNLFLNLTALGIGVGEIEGVFLTHAHDDHLAGIAALMRSGKKVKFFSTALVRTSAEKKISALLSIEEEWFADFFEVHDLEFDTWNNIGGLEVMPRFSPHPLETNTFVFRALGPNGYKSYAHLADIVSLSILKGMVVDSDAEPGINPSFFERVRGEYFEFADLKKIDIGGGMIHGLAEDFRQDESSKIIFAHRTAALTNVEKEIGCNASHGVIDVLIQDNTDLSLRGAFSLLSSSFPSIPLHHLRTLLNNTIVNYNPGSIIIREGERSPFMVLILTGSVEEIKSSTNEYSHLESGEIIGELSTLKDDPSLATYRSCGFVKALLIPSVLFKGIVARDDALEGIMKSREIRQFLRSTELFGENIAFTMQDKIIASLRKRRFEIGSVLSHDDLSYLNVIVTGKVTLLVGDELIDTLGLGDFMAEERAVFNIPCIYRIRADEVTEVYQIRGEVLREIPIVMWKLLESYQKRVRRIIQSSDDRHVFIWRDEFRVGVSTIDTHHKRLFEIANSIIESLSFGMDAAVQDNAFTSLVDYTHYHFSAEEALMVQYYYPFRREHEDQHEKLTAIVADVILKRQQGITIKADVIKTFLENWLVRHILMDDKRMGDFLNTKGVY
jgi:hemerythrin